jgi:alpha-ketoglutarate-dependent taurine dioxygenase
MTDTSFLRMPEIRDRRAWTRDSVASADWRVPISRECVAELEGAVDHIRRDPLPVVLREPSEFPLRACAETMAGVRRLLDDGIGLAVLDRLPVERWSEDESRAVYWLLGSLLGRTVAQKWDGTMIYDVRDTGRGLGYGVRRSVTNLDLQFHTDGAWLAMPADLVGLCCLNPAREGGVSRFVSLYTVHNELARRHPDLLDRLYQPYCWDRQAEHAVDDAKISRRPVFHWNGARLLARYYEGLVVNGQELAGEELDATGREALAAMRAVVDSPQLWVEFTIERGQVQYLNNHQFAHSRTDFVDHPEPHLKRHMIRLWHRQGGRRTFHGEGHAER